MQGESGDFAILLFLVWHHCLTIIFSSTLKCLVAMEPWTRAQWCLCCVTFYNWELTWPARSSDQSAFHFFLYRIFESPCLKSSSTPHSSGVKTLNSATGRKKSYWDVSKCNVWLPQESTKWLMMNGGHSNDVIFRK